MGRLTTFINEKVSKKEIDDSLKYVRLGAEFEFKIDNDRFQDIWENRRQLEDESEEYDDSYKQWQDDHYDWEH